MRCSSRGVGQRNPLHVEVQVGQRAFKVGGDVAFGMRREMGLQMAHDAHFGGYVERLREGAQQIGLACEVKPQQAVAFERKTLGAQRIGPCVYIAVGEEPAEPGAAHGAFRAASPVEQPDKRHGPSGHALQHGARQVVQGPANQSFHLIPVFCPLRFRLSAGALCRRRSVRWRA